MTQSPKSMVCLLQLLILPSESYLHFISIIFFCYYSALFTLKKPKGKMGLRVEWHKCSMRWTKHCEVLNGWWSIASHKKESDELQLDVIYNYGYRLKFILQHVFSKYFECRLGFVSINKKDNPSQLTSS